MTYLEKIIKEEGPILSADLLERLMNNGNGISNEAARKRLSRIKNNVSKTKGLFTNGQILFYDSEIFGSEQYYEGLARSLKKAGKQYHIILNSLDFHYGQVRLDQLAAYSINPIKNLKGHYNFTNAVDKLRQQNLVLVDEQFVTLSHVIAPKNISISRAKAVEVAKNFILIQFNDWTRKIGLVSYNSTKFHSEFGNYQFNFVVPSYIGSLPRINGDKKIPGFVISDILIGNTINEYQVEFFLNKIKTLKFRNYIARFIPFLIVDSMYASEQLRLRFLKSVGGINSSD